MRGKPGDGDAPQGIVRIIPAHAGQTISLSGILRRRADHPRACGANAYQAGFTAALDGSSPRMRGKLAGVPRAGRRRRIIPAHAGQTSHESTFCVVEPDHPRACGANFPITALLCVLFGSSPRMRGKRLD